MDICMTHGTVCKSTYHVVKKSGNGYKSLAHFNNAKDALATGKNQSTCSDDLYIQERHHYRYNEQFHNPCFEPVKI